MHPGGPRQQVFLLALLMNANRPLSLSWLIDALWEDDPPASAKANLRNYASAIRKSIRDIKGSQLLANGGTYRITLDGRQLDLTRFEQLTHSARASISAGDHEAAARDLAEAIALYRGPVGAGLTCGRPLAAHFAALNEQRLSALEELAGIELSLGRYGEAAMRLRLMLAETPLRERYWSLLMRALYGLGDPAGALSAFAEARARLADELGIDPGLELQAVHRAVLRRDPCLGAR